mgnify:CR=1 FL=1
MFRNRLSMTTALLPLLALAAYGSDADTSASASNNGRRDGTASSTAHYEGDVGFARTQSHSGTVSTARGVAVGVDRDGVSLSVSQAIAPRLGPAIGVNFNMSIARNGQVSSSTGTVVADGSANRSVTTGGSASTNNGRPVSTAIASGRTGPSGTVQASTRSYSSPTVRRDVPRLTVRENPSRESVTSHRAVRSVRTIRRSR